MDNIYIEKPREVKAIQYKGYDSLFEIEKFMGDHFEEVLFKPFSKRLIISEGEPEVEVGDYIIKDKRKLFYSLPQKYFEAIYTKAN